MINITNMTNKFKVIYYSIFLFIWYGFYIQSLASLSLLLNISLSKWLILGAVILSFLSINITDLLVSKKSDFFKWSFISLGIFLLTFIYSLGLTHTLYDISFDGQGYHGEAISTMIDGWNPILQTTSSGISQYADDGKQNVFLDSYPKFNWYQGTIIYNLTQNFKDIKFFNIAIILPAFIISYLCLEKYKFSSSKNYQKFIQVFLSVLIILNPVGIIQSTSNSLDGLVYYVMVILFGLFILLNNALVKNQKQLITVHGIHLTLVSCLLINIKTSALIYVVLFSAPYLLYVLIKFKKSFLKILSFVVAGLFMGIVVLGYNPYMTNIINGKNLIYPILDSKVDYFSVNTPSNLLDKNGVEIFFYTLFSASDNKDNATLKLPFTINNDEIVSMQSAQPKKAGLGPLFSGIFLLAIFVAMMHILDIYGTLVRLFEKKEIDGDQTPFTRNQDLNKIILYSLVSLVFFGSLVISKNSSSFRLIPQLWILFIIQLLFGFLNQNKISRVICWLISSLTIVNLSLIFGIYFWNQVNTSNEYQKKLNSLSTSGDYYKIYFGYSTGTRTLLRESKILFQYSPITIRECNPAFSDYKINQSNDSLICIDNTSI